MGVLDKLMFWKKDTVELDYEVGGCFTLPSEGAEDEATPAAEPVTTSQPSPDQT